MSESSQPQLDLPKPEEQLPMGSDDIIRVIADIKERIPPSQQDLNEALQAFWDPTTGNFKNTVLINTTNRLHKGLKGDYQQIDDLESALEKVQETEKAVTTDSLTGLLNKHGFERALEQTIYACARNKTGFVLMLTDLDNFKGVNDTYGHEAGDEVIRIVGKRVSEKIRKTDHIGRLGGDEYGIILPETDIHRAKQILDIIQGSFDQDPIIVRDTPSKSTDSIEINSGMSLGAVYINPEEAQKIEEKLEELRKKRALIEFAQEMNPETKEAILEEVSQEIADILSDIKDQADQAMYHNKALRKAHALKNSFSSKN